MIPVMVLTGFLGSGKTTLLSRLLKSPAFSRTAVIINEFGEMGLDHELVEASDESFIELQTGCLCCTIRSDLLTTVGDLLHRREQKSLPAFERIVIETSGLADPAPILQALMCDDGLAGRAVLAGVVATVDAVNAAASLDRQPESVKQIAVADQLVLTKADLVAGDLSQLRARLTRINPGAEQVLASFGEIDEARLFVSSFYDPSSKVGDVATWLASEEDDHTHATPADLNRHDDQIRHHAMVVSTPVPAVTLTLFLEALAEQCGADLLRLKAIVNIAESPERPAVIHGVQHVFHPPTWLKSWPSQDRGSRFVFICRDIPSTFIECLFVAIAAEVQDVDLIGQPHEGND